MSIEQRVADLEAKMQQLQGFTDTSGLYMSRYLGEEIDDYLDRIAGGFDNFANKRLDNLDTPQLALANIGAGVRSNELINPGFIDQLNSGPYVGSVYGPDGIIGLSGVTKSLSNGVLTLSSSVASNASAYFLTGITNWADAAGKQVTVSVLTTENELVTLTRTIPADQTVVIGTAASSFGNISILFSSQRGFLLSVGVPNSQVSIPKDGVKFEFGPNQTLAYQDSNGDWQLLPQPDSSYGAQLLECQRYQFATPNRSMWVRVSRISENSLFFEIPTPTIMRISSPSLSETDKEKFLITAPTSSSPVTGFEIVVSTNGPSIRIAANKTSHGLTDATLEIRGRVIFNATL